jgi:uncharacterized protein YdeI (YjbR/CyaY-like superfamily)
MATNDPRVDSYIRKAPPFAQPILESIRAAVHAGCPNVEETLKWSVPFFGYKGPLCTMAAFKAHARLVFWKSSLLASAGADRTAADAVARVERLTSTADLPARRALISLVKAAAALNEQGIKVPRSAKSTKPPVRVPADLRAALKKAPKALAAFQAFPPSHKREYVEWIEQAKKDETRARRITQAIAQIREGKSMNYKYQSR